MSCRYSSTASQSPPRRSAWLGPELPAGCLPTSTADIAGDYCDGASLGCVPSFTVSGMRLEPRCTVSRTRSPGRAVASASIRSPSLRIAAPLKARITSPARSPAAEQGCPTGRSRQVLPASEVCGANADDVIGKAEYTADLDDLIQGADDRLEGCASQADPAAGDECFRPGRPRRRRDRAARSRALEFPSLAAHQVTAQADGGPCG